MARGSEVSVFARLFFPTPWKQFKEMCAYEVLHRALHVFLMGNVFLPLIPPPPDCSLRQRHASWEAAVFIDLTYRPNHYLSLRAAAAVNEMKRQR